MREWQERIEMAEKSRAVEDILDRLHEAAEKEGKVSVDDIVAVLGDRGWGPFLFVPAIIEISPIGGIPGVPSLLALIIAIFAVQIAWGRDNIWLPGFLGRRSVSSERMRKAVEKVRPVGERLDKWFHGRLPQFTSDRATRVAAIVVLLLCLTVPPLELLPFASTAPMAAIATFGLALMLGDGLLMALGFAFSAIAVAVGFGLWGGGGSGA
jgi:hypothetical protein